MAATRTTLSSAFGINDTSLVPASPTGFLPGAIVRIDQETLKVQQGYVAGSTPIPVLRGQDGTPTGAHVSGAGVVVELATDPTGATPSTSIQWPIVRGRTMTSYSAAGAIALPSPGSDAVAIINGTNALAMTLANPAADQDGSILYILGNGKAAHTVTYTGGLGAGGTALDTLTFATGGQQCLAVIAANQIWVPMPSVLAGTLTAITITAS